MPVLENARYEKFVQCLIAGMSQRKAYREAFKQSIKWKDSTVDSKASDLLKNGDLGKVLERYKELQEEAQDAAILTRKERMITLSGIVNNSESVGDQIRAIDILNKMDQIYTQKLELSGGMEVKQENSLSKLTFDQLKELAAKRYGSDSNGPA